MRDCKRQAFFIKRVEEALLDSHFYNIGAVVVFLKTIEWQIPDFSVDHYHERLLAMHRQIQESGAFRTEAHRFLIKARKS